MYTFFSYIIKDIKKKERMRRFEICAATISAVDSHPVWDHLSVLPADVYGGSDAVTEMYTNRGVEVAQEIIDAKKADLGLNLPFFQQYLSWLQAMLHGNMGTSYVTGEAVLESFLRKLPATIFADDTIDTADGSDFSALGHFGSGPSQ